MTILKHELKEGRISLLIWAAAISFLLGVCILIYPEMEKQMGEISAMFADMGGFSQAFGMDRVNFGEFSGFFAVECGNVLGLGGALFAALLGISAFAKEEKEHTAEFLLSPPVPRTAVAAGKLGAILVQLFLLTLASMLVTLLCMVMIRETIPFSTLALLFSSYFFMQLETATITFGISAFLRRGGMGIGLGLAALFYFVNLLSNLLEETKFLKYFTPFGYAEGADILTEHSIPLNYFAVGMVFSLAGILLAFWQYRRKDIS